MSSFRLEQSKAYQALVSILTKEERLAFEKIVENIRESLPEQSADVIQELVMEILEEKHEGKSIVHWFDNPKTTAQTAIDQYKETLRQGQHIGALVTGIAVCALVIFLTSLIDIVKIMMSGKGLTESTTILNLGHIICFIALLAGTRILVMEDKRGEHGKSKRIIVGIMYIAALIALLLAIFVEPIAILVVPSHYLLVLSLVLVILWRLSAKL